MSTPKPQISVRPPPRPLDVEAFVSGQPLAANAQGPAADAQPPASSGQGPAANLQPSAASGQGSAANAQPLAASGQGLTVSPQPSAASVERPAPQPLTAVQSAASAPAVSRQPRRRRGIVERAGGVERARLTVYIDPNDAAKLRRYCFENGVEISDVAADAIGRMVAGL